MLDSSTDVGFLSVGPLSDEQRAALSWLERLTDPTVVELDAADDAASFDALWWHRDEPIGPETLDEMETETVESAVRSGTGLLCTLRGMAAVDAFGFDAVAPDTVGEEAVGAPTGLLWRSLYDDHPVADAFDGRRTPLCVDGDHPVVRYESVLPERGEPLAATVRDGVDEPSELSVVSWAPDDGAVLGVGTPLSFAANAPETIEAARDRVVAACLGTVADGDVRPARPHSRAELSAMREHFDDDHHRPEYHLTPPANWLNDPNGLVRWNDQYHVFYQYNPGGPFHNTIHWGHAVSDDLLHWRDEPVALSPSSDGPDRLGCWSGCAVDDDGTASLLYTGGAGRRQLPCLATTDDPDLVEWEKDDGNPVIDSPPEGIDLLGTGHWDPEFRDHCVWRSDGTWYQLIGAGLADGGGVVLLYVGESLREWRYEGAFLTETDGSVGTVWECPEWLDLGETELLHVSNYEDVVYFLGEQRDGSFEVESEGLLDHGDFYAPQSLSDGDRDLTWGWLPEARDESAQWDAGWSGVLSLPRVLSAADGELRQQPAAELTELRERKALELGERTLTDGDRRQLAVSGRTLELELTVSLSDASAFELSVFESADGTERTPIRYTSENELLIEREASGPGEATTETQQLTVTPYDEPLTLRLYLDGSIVEAFVNERHCLTSRVYPSAESTGLSVSAEGGAATIESLSVWELETGVSRP